MNKILRMLGIFLIILSALLLIAVPPVGIIGIIFGALCIVRSKKELADKISSGLAKVKEKSEQRAESLNQKLEQLKGQTITNKPSISDTRSLPQGEGRTNRDRNRMEEAELRLYVWSTCGDERVCEACKIMDDKLCRWESPYVFSEDGGKTWKRRPKGAIMMHPGQHEGCRCTSLAYYPEILSRDYR